MERCHSVFRSLLQTTTMSLPFTVISYIVFVNPNFTLYQAPRNLPIIYHSQLEDFVDRLIQQGTNMKTTMTHRKLADELISKCLRRSAYTEKPVYSLEKLRNGVFCSDCCGLMDKEGWHLVKCTRCGLIEKTDDCILRSIEEFRVLFPHLELTTDVIYKCVGFFQ